MEIPRQSPHRDPSNAGQAGGTRLHPGEECDGIAVKLDLRRIWIVVIVTLSLSRATIIKVPQDQERIQDGTDAAVQGDTVPADTGISSELFELEEQVLDLVNQYRISQNIRALTTDLRIAQQAREHSRAMANKQILVGHYGFDLRVDRISTFLPIGAAAENVAFHRGCSDCAQNAVQGWLESNAHRKKTEGEWGLTGVGVARDINGGYYFTQIFCRKGR